MPGTKKQEEVPIRIVGTHDADVVKEGDGKWRFKEIRLKMELMSPCEEDGVEKPWRDSVAPLLKQRIGLATSSLQNNFHLRNSLYLHPWNR